MEDYRKLPRRRVLNQFIQHYHSFTKVLSLNNPKDEVKEESKIEDPSNASNTSNEHSKLNKNKMKKEKMEKKRKEK